MNGNLNPQTGIGGTTPFPGKTGDFPLRVLLYSHDSWGLGHLRRSLAIAGALTDQFAYCNVLVVTGSPCATQFDIPSRCDVLKLPAVSKDGAGQYVPRSFSGCVSKTIELRRRLIHESYRSFDPHVILVDHQVTGMHGEAFSTLKEAREHGKLLIYGMRDILDSPDRVEQAWSGEDHRWALNQAYDRICIYGTPEVFDSPVQYKSLAPLRHKIEFTGYIATPLRKTNRHAIPSFRKKVLVTMGGGEDGMQRIEAYIEALLLEPVFWDSHIVTGPLMEKTQVRHFKRKIQRHGLAEQVRISRFYPDLSRLLQESDAVVSMAGYNSCAEILQNGIPTVLMPRYQPRKEQLIRARRFEELGLAQCVIGEDPLVLRQAVEHALDGNSQVGTTPDLKGLDKLCEIIEELLSLRTGRAQRYDLEQLKVAAE